MAVGEAFDVPIASPSTFANMYTYCYKMSVQHGKRFRARLITGENVVEVSRHPDDVGPLVTPVTKPARPVSA